MKYSLLGLILSILCAPVSLIAMNHQRNTCLVNWTEKTDLQKNTRTVNCQVNNASYSGVTGLIEVQREYCIISGRLIHIMGTITLNTGRAFPIAPTDISTCFDQISALRLVDLRNEERQRQEAAKIEASKGYQKNPVIKTAWKKAQ